MKIQPTELQISNISDNFIYLKKQLGEKELSADNIAEALGGLCHYMPYEERLNICNEMQQGIEAFRSAWSNMGAAQTETYSEGLFRDLINKPTDNMSDAQAKGYYLRMFQSLHAGDINLVQEIPANTVTPEIASLSLEELRDLVSEQAKNTFAVIAFEAVKNLKERKDSSDSENGNINLKIEPSDALIMAAAEYAGGINGDIPEVFTEQPMLLGASAAANSQIVQSFEQAVDSGYDFETEEWIESFLMAIGCALACAVVGAAMLGAAALITGTGIIAVFVSSLAITLGLYAFSFAVIAAIGAVISGLAVLAKVAVPKMKNFYKRFKSANDIVAVNNNKEYIENEEVFDEDEEEDYARA